MVDNEFSESNDALNKLASEVLLKYNIEVENISVIQSGTIKTVWKIKAKSGMLCLKRLKHTYDKAVFSVNAQIYIKGLGGNVPEVLTTSGGQAIVKHNEQLFVLYEWLHGKALTFSGTPELLSAIEGLAKFHLYSKGYTPPPSAKISSKLGKWPSQYDSMNRRLMEWKEISKSIPLPYHSTYFKQADPIISVAGQAMDLLSRSNYGSITYDASSPVVLCHQDYGKGNAVMTDKGVYVIDLDGVTFDLPARDLRKIIGKTSENKGQWEAAVINNILRCYTKINPLNSDEKKLLYIDMLFPHWFFGLVKNLFQNNKPLKPSEIEKTARLELSKVPLLISLLNEEGMT